MVRQVPDEVSIPQQGADPDREFAELPDDVKRTLLALGNILTCTSEESKYHLESALGARRFGGIAGDLVIRVPRRVNEHVLVKWVGGGIAMLSVVALALAFLCVPHWSQVRHHPSRAFAGVAASFGHRRDGYARRSPNSIGPEIWTQTGLSTPVINK